MDDTDLGGAPAPPPGACCSVLWPMGTRSPSLRMQPPDCFGDLRLDQLVATAIKGREAHDLAPIFHTPVRDTAQVRYRQAVAADLEGTAVRSAVDAFADAMRLARRHRALSTRLQSSQAAQVWFVHAAQAYAGGVSHLAADLERCELRSAGLIDVRRHVIDLAASDAHRQLGEDVEQVQRALEGVAFDVHVVDLSITVTRGEADALDYGDRIAATFERFRQDAGDGGRDDTPDGVGLSAVEVGVVERVAQLHPEVFGTVTDFCTRHADHADATVMAFDREVQFYLAYIDLIAVPRAAGLPFCDPDVVPGTRDPDLRDAFDLALACSGVGGIVTNDLVLQDPERIVVLTGANQGGKTTFARTVGQIHHLARLGLMVPGTRARLSLCDEILTHFPRQERAGDLRGRLLDDLVRLREIVDRVTPESLVILNETFGSTTLADARTIGARTLQAFAERDVLCVYATFIDELAHAGETTVSMVATVDPDDPALRTFQVVRQPADGRAHASAIARTYGLTYDALLSRVGR